MKKESYWIDHTSDLNDRARRLCRYMALKKEIRKIPCHSQTHKKFTFVRYADDWLVGVCGSKEDCIALKAEIAEFLREELKLTLSEEKTLITHSSKEVRFIGYDIRACLKNK